MVPGMMAITNGNAPAPVFHVLLQYFKQGQGVKVLLKRYYHYGAQWSSVCWSLACHRARKNKGFPKISFSP